MVPPKNAKVIEWDTSTIWFDENGILYSVSKKVPPQTMEEAIKSVEDFKKITGGKKVCMLADVTNSAETTKEMRDWAAIELPKLIKAIAMVSQSPLGKMLANLFFRVKKQPYPVKMFTDEEEAKEWLLQYL
jgi:microsomal dipeptidase-like Zn-dependent dipeptidase